MTAITHWFQDAVHYSHELAGCICQAKWQDSPLVLTKFSRKGRLLPVGCGDANFMVTSCQVKFLEPAAAVDGVEEILDVWERITMIDGYGVYSAIIYTHAQSTIRIWHK
jgi:hypothetical protein